MGGGLATQRPNLGGGLVAGFQLAAGDEDVGTVGGEVLSVKTAGGEFTAPVSELHDAWWNAIARAMA